MPEHQKEILAAADDFYSIILSRLKDNKGVHAETAVASASRMAGTFLLRSFGLPLDSLEPGTAVLSDLANEKGPGLVALLGNVLTQLKVPAGSPPSEAPAEPQLTVLETQKLLEPELDRARSRHELSLAEGADAAAITAGLLIRDCATVLAPKAAFEIAAYGFVEGSKTVPMKVAPSG